MKLKKEFLLHDTGSESLLVPTGAADFSGIVKGNRTLGTILGLLNEEASEDQIVAELKSRFEAPEGSIERDVARVLEELRRIGALDE